MVAAPERVAEMTILNAKQDGIPVPEKKYVVEMDLAIFETDIPPQHGWTGHSKNFRTLWTRTLRQTVEWAEPGGLASGSHPFRSLWKRTLSAAWLPSLTFA
jgi:hypothetical protein